MTKAIREIIESITGQLEGLDILEPSTQDKFVQYGSMLNTVEDLLGSGKFSQAQDVCLKLSSKLNKDNLDNREVLVNLVDRLHDQIIIFIRDN